MIRSLLTSPSLIYVVLRYVTYALAFINTLLLAKFLGGFEYGVYSFVILVMAYMSYSNLGINESLNTEFAKYKHWKISEKYWDNAWTLNLLISIAGAVLFALVYVFYPNIFSEYRFSGYAVQLIITCFVINLGRIYITYYKLHGKLIKLNIQQILPNISIFLLAVILRGKINISVIVWTLLITNLLALIIFRIGLPRVPHFLISSKLTKVLISRGLSLLMYNFSFYFFILLASSVVSAEYTVIEFGCFSLSNSITNGVIMAGGAFMFIFYPKILNAMNRSKTECASVIKRIKAIYVVAINIICILSVPAVIGISYLYPQYSLSLVRIYTILIVGKCINNATTGYSAYLIANKKELKMTVYAVFAVIIEWCFMAIFIKLRLSMEYIALAVVIGSLIYTSLVIIAGARTLTGKCSLKDWNSEIFGNGNWLLLFLLLVYAFFLTNIYFMIVSFFVYYFLNRKSINESLNKGLEIIRNRDAINF